MTQFLFAIYALVTCGGAIGVVACRNVVRMAVCLTVSLGGVAGLFLLAGAEFVAAAQLLVYVGGTAIVLVFGVMLTAQQSLNPPKPNPNELITAIGVGAALLMLVAVTVLRVDWPEPQTTAELVTHDNGVKPLGLSFLGIRLDGRAGYLFPFEIVSVHLLVVLVGAGYMARATRTHSVSSQGGVSAGGTATESVTRSTPEGPS